jgi:hypothetical protein
MKYIDAVKSLKMLYLINFFSLLKENIRRTLEKKYNETLKRAGIVEHELRKTNRY